MHQFLFQCPKEALDRRVVPAVTFAAHAAQQLKGYSTPLTCYGLSFDKLKDLAASMDSGESKLTVG